jgi:branched-chain amino acid transport system permease protein
MASILSIKGFRGKIFLLLAVLALIVFPFLNHNSYVQHLVVVAMLFAMIASNWDLSLGYAGVFNWAHPAFFAVAAYIAGIMTKSFGISHWVALLMAVAVAVFASVIICLPVLRIRGIYVALVTFAFGQLCLHVIMSMSDYTGGAYGLVLIPTMKIGGYSLAAHGKIGFYYLILIVFLASTIFLRYLVKSHFGLSIVALRDYEEYAISRGVALSRQRLLTFAFSALFTGASGALYAFYFETASPDLFNFSYTATFLSMILLGGISTIYGPILGAFVLTFVSEFLVSLGPWRQIIVASIIIVVLLFYPEGAFPGFQKVTRRIKGFFRGKSKQDKDDALLEQNPNQPLNP